MAVELQQQQQRVIVVVVVELREKNEGTRDEADEGRTKAHSRRFLSDEVVLETRHSAIDFCCFENPAPFETDPAVTTRSSSLILGEVAAADCRPPA